MTNKDIHKWTDGRYTLMFDEHTFFVWDNEKDERMCALEVTEKLNEQQATIRKLQDLCGKSDYENAKLRQEIKELKAQLREKEEDERLYANEIVKLNKEAKEVLDFKSLGGNY